MDLKEIDILGESIATHWYYRSKAAALTRLIGHLQPAVILDVGAGSGFFARHLLVHTQATEAWCIDPSYPDDTEAQVAGKPIYYRRALSPLNADLVLLMDVLEHVDDDAGLLADCLNQVPSSARFLISVPAFQWLWSGHDDFLGHKRRYTLRQIEAVIRRSGLDVECGVYYFGLVLPAAVVTRLGHRRRSGLDQPRSQLKRHRPLINGLLTTICHAELSLLPFNRLAGLTAICLARRP